MAVRNCLECQQAQSKHGTEISARSYTTMPSTMLGTSKSASAQASNPNHLLTSLSYSTQCYTLKSNPKIQMNNSGLPLSFFTLIYTSSFALFQYSLVNQKELYPLSCPPTTTKCYCISSCYYITALVAICDTRQGLLSLPLWFDTVVSSKVMLFFPEPGVKAHL